MDFLTELTILVLAAFVGFEVISKVPNTLVIAIAFGTINVVGGFLVTDRMLEMFRQRPQKPSVRDGQGPSPPAVRD
jgi:NAD(P) transhydrogenase subunit alpha